MKDKNTWSSFLGVLIPSELPRHSVWMHPLRFEHRPIVSNASQLSFTLKGRSGVWTARTYRRPQNSHQVSHWLYVLEVYLGQSKFLKVLEIKFLFIWLRNVQNRLTVHKRVSETDPSVYRNLVHNKDSISN